jgi:hypothetical protein
MIPITGRGGFSGSIQRAQRPSVMRDLYPVHRFGWSGSTPITEGLFNGATALAVDSGERENLVELQRLSLLKTAANGSRN